MAMAVTTVTEARNRGVWSSLMCFISHCWMGEGVEFVAMMCE